MLPACLGFDRGASPGSATQFQILDEAASISGASFKNSRSCFCVTPFAKEQCNFILRYVDDLALRQAIEKQLNKVELANRFTRAVAVGNPREYTQTEKEEQEITEACNRLIRNAIICWNYLYLARQLEKAPDAEVRENLRRTIVAHSPMSWAHINMLGEYDFSEEKLRDTLGVLPPKKAA